MRTRIKPNILVLLGWNDPVVFAMIGRFAKEAGWHLELRPFFSEAIPIGWKGDGMIVSHGERKDVMRFIRKQAKHQPTVIFGGNNPGIIAPCVSTDDYAAGKLAAEHLLQQGHRHFAWYAPFAGEVSSQRYKGFADTLKVAGQECLALNIPMQEWRQRKRLLAGHLRGLPRPLALFALDDQAATEIIELCLEEGWKVPQEIAVMGCGNIELACECSHVPITSIDQQEAEAAWQTAALLDRLLKGGRAPKKPIVIPPKGVIRRQSTDTLVISDPRLQLVVTYLQEHLASMFSLIQVAEHAGISLRLLHKLFLKELHTTPSKFLLRLRLERACQRLTNTSDPISDIASLCGLSPMRNMNRCFQRELHCTPRQYRNTFTRPQ